MSCWTTCHAGHVSSAVSFQNLNENWVESRIWVLEHQRALPTSWGSSMDWHLQYYVLLFLDGCKSQSHCHLQMSYHQKSGSHQIQLRANIASNKSCPSQWEKHQMRFDHLLKRSDSSPQTPPSSFVPWSCECRWPSQTSQTHFALPCCNCGQWEINSTYPDGIQ